MAVTQYPSTASLEQSRKEGLALWCVYYVKKFTDSDEHQSCRYEYLQLKIRKQKLGEGRSPHQGHAAPSVKRGHSCL